MTAINEIVLKEWRAADETSTLVAKIAASGELVLDGYDSGALVQQQWDDWDYEYALRVEHANVTSVLLWLIKERFDSASDFKSWLEAHAIAHTFESWV